MGDVALVKHFFEKKMLRALYRNMDDGVAELISECVQSHEPNLETIERLKKTNAVLTEFVGRIARDKCYELPGEYPESGEDGQAQCLSCQARELLA